MDITKAPSDKERNYLLSLLKQTHYSVFIGKNSRFKFKTTTLFGKYIFLKYSSLNQVTVCCVSWKSEQNNFHAVHRYKINLNHFLFLEIKKLKIISTFYMYQIEANLFKYNWFISSEILYIILLIV